jgi:hypothetical protein
LYKNTKEVWKEEILIETSDKMDEEKWNMVWQQKPKYYEGHGKQLKRYADGWMDDGRYYYKDLLRIFKEDLKIHPVWKCLSNDWMTYHAKHYGKQNQNTMQEIMLRTTVELKVMKKTGESF